MRRNPLGGLTIKAALILGFGLTLALWLVTGYQLTQSMAAAETQAAAIAARYVQSQDLLATLRAQILAASGTARDALLDRTQQPLPASVTLLETRVRGIERTVDSYVTVMASTEEQARLMRLRQEAAEFGRGVRAALADAGPTVDGRERFRAEVLPRREAVLNATEALQSLNRSAFVQYRKDLADVHGAAEQATRRQLGLALLCGLGIAVLATLYAGRLEKRLISELIENALKTRALQDLSIKMIRAQEDERRRIAHELHDEIGQALTAIKVELSLAQRASGGVSPQLLESAQAITDGALHTVRDLSQLLHPAVLDDLGLPEAVDTYLREFSRRFGIRTDLTVEGLATRLPADVEVAAYRMMQEALTNVARHARATRCQVRLARTDDRFEILVRDDGEGFNPAEAEQPGGRRGLGLIGMRERALQLAGVVTIDSAPGRGTVVRIVLSPRPPVLSAYPPAPPARAPLADSV
jgi:signal transduction histidine kinase